MHDKSISISIIVPIYNAEKYLKRCIGSILEQTFEDFELILIDDGSPDNCGRICDIYSEKDRRIRVFHQKNQGQAAARNHAVQEAKGKYVCFVDADDVIHPQMIEVLYKAISGNNVQISVCGAFEGSDLPESFFGKKAYNVQILNINEEELLRLYKGKYVYWVPWAKMIEKSIVLKYPFPEGRKYEDNAVVYKWLCNSREIALCDGELYFYFVNNSGTTKSQYSLKVLDCLLALKEQADYYRKIGNYRMLQEIVPRYVKESICERNRIIRILHNRHAANKLKRDVCFFGVRYHRFISCCDQKYMIANMFPKLYLLSKKLRDVFK